MRHLKLTVAYDGTAYAGWQVQPESATVQQQLESAWQSLTGEQLRITASGRTDAGVHAAGQVCSLETETVLTCHRLIRGINAHLPEDISVLDVESAPSGFHAIRDASRKTYQYLIQYGHVRNPLSRHRAWYCPRQLRLQLMAEAARHLIGEHDFASFQAAGSDRTSTVRNLTVLDCCGHRYHGSQYIAITATCDGFLYNMVRNIVGTLVEVGRGRQRPEWVHQVLRDRDRSLAGQTAPAHGLMLIQVEYDGIDFRSDGRGTTLGV